MRAVRLHGQGLDTLVVEEVETPRPQGVFVYDRRAWRGILAQILRYSGWIGINPGVPRMRIASVAGGVPTHMTAAGGGERRGRH